MTTPVGPDHEADTLPRPDSPSRPAVFAQEHAPKQIEELPGVYVFQPKPRELGPGQIDLGERMDFGELFTVVDTNVPAEPPAPKRWARCQTCLADVELDRSLAATGPETTFSGAANQHVVGRLSVRFCSERCRLEYEPVLWGSTPEPARDPAVDAFHEKLYSAPKVLRWLGAPLVKNPLDLLVYQEILHEVRPDLIIETGTLKGGSALYLATVLDALGSGHVVSVDVEHRSDRPQHPRITYVRGSSTDPGVVGAVGRMSEGRRTLAILDSDHSRDHVLAELRAYAPMVDVGSYIIVEDTDVNGHPVLPSHGPGPAEAVSDFLAERADFVRDFSRQKFLVTSNPGGFLRRVRPQEMSP